MNSVETQQTPNVHVPHFPQYDQARSFLQVMHGQSQRVFFAMRETVSANKGTPQETQDWTRPEQWILEVLQGEERELAFRLWRMSDGRVNPRHVTGLWLLCSSYELLRSDAYDNLHLTELGEDFINNPLGEAVQSIDYSEGLLNLLLITAEHGPGKRSDLMPVYGEFLERYSNYRSQSVINHAWYQRMRNLLERGLISRSGVTYEVTHDGLSYLERVGGLIEQTGREPVTGPQNEIRRLLKQQRSDVRERLRETPLEMDRSAVECLVKRVLEVMGYEDVEVTSRSGDSGIDVVANIEVGITPVREFIQVKRHKGSIGRPVLDQVRGALYYFNANRGTIITTGRFSKGAQEVSFMPGAPPITLIDGERFLDLLIEHEIGVRKRSVQLLEFEPADFIEEEAED